MKNKLLTILTVTALMTGFVLNPCVAKSSKELNKGANMKRITQTAGRVQLGNFAPEFAHFNDDILFGEN